MEISKFEDDLLGLEEFAKRLDKFIATELDFVEGSLVLALSAKFGYGKTTFLKMWSSSLEKADKKEDKEAGKKKDKPFVISLNAWESDYYGDPLFAIISALVDCIQEEEGEESAKELKKAAKDVGWAMAAIGGQILKKISGIDIFAIGNLVLVKRAKREDDFKPDTFSAYEDRKKAMQNLKHVLQDFVQINRGKVFFFVDELDRCRPDYAISYLETIKHIFDVEGAVFILAADRQQLENSAKKAFGADLDFEEYYRKFVHREVSLPEISKEGYARLASEYVDHYLEREGLRVCFMELDDNRVSQISKLVGALELTPRQIQEVFRILGHILATSEKNQGSLLQNLGLGSILMAALKIGKPKIYDRLGNRSLDPQEAIEFFKDLLGEDYFVWWFRLILTGGGLKMEKNDTDEKIMKMFELPMDGALHKLRIGWFGTSYIPPASGPGPSKLIEIHEKIEQISQWD